MTSRAPCPALDALLSLDPCWVDGEHGEPVSPSTVERSYDLIAVLAARGIAHGSITPTEGGGVSFFWPDIESRLSIEVGRDGRLFVHGVDSQKPSGYFGGYVVAESANLGEALSSWLSEAFPAN